MAPAKCLWLIPMLAFGLVLAGCYQNMTTYRYRLTLVVDDNGTLRSGSSVVQVRNWSDQTLDMGGVAQHESRGEATLVDLGNGRLLLGLLDGGRPVPRNLTWEARWGAGPGSVLQQAYGPGFRQQSKTAPVLLTPDQMPTLVTFKDRNDFQTVERVDPTDLVSAFGPGVTLQSATVEVTDAPVTTGLTSILPIISNAPESGLCRNVCLFKNDFIVGVK